MLLNFEILNQNPICNSHTDQCTFFFVCKGLQTQQSSKVKTAVSKEPPWKKLSTKKGLCVTEKPCERWLRKTKFKTTIQKEKLEQPDTRLHPQLHFFPSLSSGTDLALTDSR